MQPPIQFGIGLSPAQTVYSWHAALLPVLDKNSGFSPALCNSKLWVSVDHDGPGQPRIAGPDDPPTCLRCCRKLTSLGLLP